MSYEVQINEKVKETLGLANVDCNNSEWAPIDVVKKACEINLKDPMKPIHLQYLWFCLSNATLLRKYKDRIIKVKVRFTPVYLRKTKEITNLIYGSIKKIGSKNKLSKLCGFKSNYNVGKTKVIPITMLLKVLEISNIDFKSFIRGKRLFSSLSKTTSVAVPKIDDINISEILVWIKLEGHISAYLNRVEIKQKDISPLIYLKNAIHKNFGIDIKHIKIEPYENEYVLRITSLPFKVLLCLFYDVLPGFKSPYIDLSQELSMCKNTEDKYRFLARCIETEGSFSPITRKSGFKQPRCVFYTFSEKTALQVFQLCKELGYCPTMFKRKRSITGPEFSVNIRSIDKYVKLCYDTLPYTIHKGRTQDALVGKDRKGILTDTSVLTKYRINRVKIKPLIEKSIEKLGSVNFLAREINNRCNGFQLKLYNIYDWLRKDIIVNVPLIFVVHICSIVGDSYWRYLPDHTALILWLDGFVSFNELEKIRGQSYNLVKEVIDNQ